MTLKNILKIKSGLYIVGWNNASGAGFSLVAVGFDREGRHWFSPTNWTTPGALLQEYAESILWMIPVMTKQDLLDKVCQHRNLSYINSEIAHCADCGSIWQD